MSDERVSAQVMDLLVTTEKSDQRPTLINMRPDVYERFVDDELRPREPDWGLWAVLSAQTGRADAMEEQARIWKMEIERQAGARGKRGRVGTLWGIELNVADMTPEISVSSEPVYRDVLEEHILG